MDRLFSTMAAAAIAAIAAPLAAEAQTSPTQYQQVPVASSEKVFAAVDAVNVFGTRLIVTGVVQGEGAASSWAVTYSSTASDTVGWAAMCQRSALLALARPGEYLLTIHQFAGGAPICKLTRASP